MKNRKTFHLNIIVPMFLPPVPPSIKGGNVTTETTALLDTVVTLECERRGVPLPTITWYRDGEPILSSRHTQYVERGHYLRIPRVQASDGGHYTCRVTSVAGSAEKSYKLDVYCKIVVTLSSFFVFFPPHVKSTFLVAKNPHL